MRFTGKRLLVLLLYTPTDGGAYNVPISGRTRLMKMGFLFKQEVWPKFRKATDLEDALPEFFAWKYGPFSKDLLTDLEFLINQQYVNVSQQGAGLPLEEGIADYELAEYEHWIEDLSDFDSNELAVEVFSLSISKGVEKGKELWGSLNSSQKQILQKFKTSFNGVSLDQILLYVYREYKKEYTSKSVIKDRYLS